MIARQSRARRLSRGTVMAAGLIVAPAAQAVAQAVPTRTIGKPLAEYGEPFTVLFQARELSDGRVLVTDAQDRTVHLVDEEYDRGPVLLQLRCPVLPGDTPDTLAARVFAQECIAYPEALRRLLAERDAGAPAPAARGAP